MPCQHMSFIFQVYKWIHNEDYDGKYFSISRSTGSHALLSLQIIPCPQDIALDHKWTKSQSSPLMQTAPKHFLLSSPWSSCFSFQKIPSFGVFFLQKAWLIPKSWARIVSWAQAPRHLLKLKSNCFFHGSKQFQRNQGTKTCLFYYFFLGGGLFNLRCILTSWSDQWKDMRGKDEDGWTWDLYLGKFQNQTCPRKEMTKYILFLCSTNQGPAPPFWIK